MKWLHITFTIVVGVLLALAIGRPELPVTSSQATATPAALVWVPHIMKSSTPVPIRQQLAVVADTYIEECQPAAAHGHEAVIRVGLRSGCRTHALLRFDNEPIQRVRNFELVRAYLHLYMVGCEDCREQVFTLNGANLFEEGTTWATTPNFSDDYVGGVIYLGDGPRVYVEVRDFSLSPAIGLGTLLVYERDWGLSFASRDDPDPTKRPWLELWFFGTPE